MNTKSDRRLSTAQTVDHRLAEFANDDDRNELFELPWRTFDEAERLLRERDFRRAPKLHETALALAILLQHPMRIGNLMSLDLERHLLRDRRGRLTQVAIDVQPTRGRRVGGTGE